MSLQLTALDIAYQSFALVQADWAVERGRDLTTDLRPSHVIVQYQGAQDLFYLYQHEEFLAHLAQSPLRRTVFEALRLDMVPPTPVVDAISAATIDMPDQCIVDVAGTPVAFIDVRVPPPPGPTRSIEQRRGVGDATQAQRPADRALLAELPLQLVLDKPSSLLVSVAPVRSADGTTLALPSFAASSQIHIVVVPRRGLIIEGDTEGTLTVGDTDQTLPLRFQVRPTELGPALVEVLAFHGAQPLGLLRLGPVVLGPPDSEGERRAREQTLSPVSVRQPDLTLLVLEHAGLSGNELELRLVAAVR